MKITNKENQSMLQCVRERGFSSISSFKKVSKVGIKKVIKNNLKTKKPK